MPARVRLHLRRLRDYFACLYPLTISYEYECVCLLCCPSHLCVDVGRVDEYEEKKTEKKKSFARPLLLDN